MAAETIVVMLVRPPGTSSFDDVRALLAEWLEGQPAQLNPAQLRDEDALRFAYLTTVSQCDNDQLVRDLRALSFVEAAYVKPPDEVP